MILTRSEWLEMQAESMRKRESARAPQYRAMAQAEIVAKQVTSSSVWNVFLQFLAEMKKNSEEALAAIEEQARTSSDFSHAGLAHTQAIRRGWDMRIQTLGEVMALPAEIIDNAQKAQEKLEALNHAETNGKSESPAAS